MQFLQPDGTTNIYNKNTIFEGRRLSIMRQSLTHNFIPEGPDNARILPFSAMATSEKGTYDVGYRFTFRRFSIASVRHG